jgi:hypothetical protein
LFVVESREGTPGSKKYHLAEEAHRRQTSTEKREVHKLLGIFALAKTQQMKLPQASVV